MAIPKQYARAKSAIPTENVWSRDILTNVSDSEHRVARLDAISFAGAYFSQVREFVRIRSRR